MKNETQKFDIEKKYPFYSSIMRFGVVDGKKYNLQIDNEYNLNLFTENRLNLSSVMNGNFYVTPVELETLDDIVAEYLYVRYKNNTYKVLGVENDFSKFYLSTRGFEHFEEDKKLGFTYNNFFGAFILEVEKNEVDVFSNSESIYESIKKQKNFYLTQKKTR